MPSQSIRLLAICVFQNHGRILVNEAHDPLTGQTFFRPLGGGIEFGETSAQALAREIREEIGADVTQLRLLGTLESIFTFGGAAGHEIVQVYDGEFEDPSFYEHVVIRVTESNDQAFDAVWRNIESFSHDEPLYPAGLLPLLRSIATLPVAGD